MTKSITVTPYKGSTGKEIEVNVEGLRVIIKEMMKFKEHIVKIVLLSQVLSDVIMRTFTVRDRELMMKMVNVSIRSKIEYCYDVRLPSK